MFYTISLFFIFLLELFPLYAASYPQLEIKDENLAIDIGYRCNRSVLELPSQAVGGLFQIVASPPYDHSKIDNVRKELYDLWISEEIESKTINLEKLSSRDSSFKTKIPSLLSIGSIIGRDRASSSTEHCTIKVLGCTRDFQETNCPVGSVWSFWSDIKHSDPSRTADIISALTKWCDDFVSDELASREILLTAHGDGVWPAIIVSKWFISKDKGKNLKIVFFNPPVSLIKDLELIPREKVLLMGLPHKNYNPHGVIISGSLKNKTHIARLYEIEKSYVMSSLGMPPLDNLSSGYNLLTVSVAATIGATATVLLLRSLASYFSSH